MYKFEVLYITVQYHIFKFQFNIHKDNTSTVHIILQLVSSTITTIDASFKEEKSSEKTEG